MMGNKVKGILLFLIFASLILGAKTTVACNSGNSLTKEAMQSVNTEINPDSIDIYGNLNFICPGDLWDIFECQILFMDSIAEIYVQDFREQSINNEYFLITLNKPVTDRLKTLLYSIYSDSNTALKDGIPNERSVRSADRSDLSIMLLLNGKIVNEFFHVWDIHYSYRSIITSTNTLDPFKPPFYKMLELIYDILFQIDNEIYHGRSNRKANDWVENEFNYNYYKPGYRTVTDKIMHLRSSANAIKAIIDDFGISGADSQKQGYLQLQALSENLHPKNISNHRIYSCVIMKYIRFLNNGKKIGKRIDYGKTR